ncbi:GAF domain-containing protein [Phormidium sp. CCY1219]|uniref:GAF domain-containing protein n=1 Tax=Phormidium sp. CCY1219 TaxID=2886104 RepID=UPI002D1F607D|nr:adenylate/guanylate cyclase domain-containing protein [Phormidium sp. CCY1219]MEB3829664.1 GAF domain-containing protein [Phormidium sp. CCY1219]
MTAASPNPKGWDHSSGAVIDVTPQVEGKQVHQRSEPKSSEPKSDATSAPPNNHSSSALARTQGTFSAFLAPLNKDSFTQVVKDVEEKLEVVNQTLSMLDSLLDSQGFDAILDEMLRSITLKTGELLGADRSTIFLLDEEKNELWSIIAKGEGGKPLEIRIPADKGIAGEVATFKKVVNIPFDFFDDPRSGAAKEQYKKTGYRTYTMLCMPLLNEQGDLVAVVQLLNKLKKLHDPEAPLSERINAKGFTEEDENVFEEFAPSIRLILESSRSFYKATQRQRAAAALMSATQSLSKSSLDLEETLKKVMDEAKQLMNADRSTLWLIDRDKNDLWTKIPIGPRGELKEIRIPMGVGYAGTVAKSGEPLNIPFDLYDHQGSETSKRVDQTSGYRTCSLLCMPVFNSDRELIGVTQLVNKKKQGEHPPYDPSEWPNAPDCWKASFNRSDQEFMQAFNTQAGVALQNAKLFATVKQQEQLQRDILRSLSNAVISTDKSGHVIAANESARILLGMENSDRLEGKLVRDLIRLEAGDFSKWFDAALEGKDEKARQQYYPDQTLVCASNDEEHSIHLSINSIADASDPTNVYGALVVMEDISDEKRLKSTMYRYMTQEVAEQLLASGDTGLGGQRKEVSVLFSDIRSYTTLTEGMQAEEVVAMLNEYFESMVDAVFKYKGTLDKYIGDAIMAVFGSPLPLKDHAWCAVQTAVEMRKRLIEFNNIREAEGKQTIKIGIGIHSDEVVSGNIGSSKRMELTSIGDGVNLGSRLEGTSKMYGTDIVISEKTYLPCADKIYVRELDYITVKGKSEPVKIYELVGLKSDPIPEEKLKIVEHYSKGREYYLSRQFAKALKEFGEVMEIDKNNKAAAVHMERCQHFVVEPPPDDWDGVWKLTEK